MYVNVFFVIIFLNLLAPRAVRNFLRWSGEKWNHIQFSVELSQDKE